MRSFFVAAFVAALLSVCSIASAQPYPSRPVTMVVPFAAGGPVDTVARILAEPMKKALGQTVLVDNTTGAAGTIGVGRVARAAPDGYLLSIGHWSTHVVNGAIYPLTYDLLKDFEPVAMLASNPMIIVTKSTVPVSKPDELVPWLKSSKQSLMVGTAGVGSGTHMGGLYLQNTTGAKFEYVPYRGSGPALQDLLAGQLDIIVDQLSNALPQVRGGRIRAHAVTAKARSAAAPDIPSVDEVGLNGLYTSIWYGVWAPKDTPKNVIAKLNSAITESLADPVVQQRFSALGLEIVARDQQTPDALRAHQKSEIDKWWPMIKAAGVKAE